MPSKTVGTLVIDFKANTVALKAAVPAVRSALQEVQNAAEQASQGMVSQNQAAAGFLRDFEGGLNNNMRAVENFMTKILGLGPLMQNLFPIAGGIAFGKMLADVGVTVYNFFQKIQAGQTKAEQDFYDLNQSLRTEIDELQLSTEKTIAEADKLLGHPGENKLKLEIMEAIVASDKLNESLKRNFATLEKTLKESEQEGLARIFSGEVDTEPLRVALYGKYKDQGPLGKDLREAQRRQAQQQAALKGMLGKGVMSDSAIQAEIDKSLQAGAKENDAILQHAFDIAKKYHDEAQRQQKLGPVFSSMDSTSLEFPTLKDPEAMIGAAGNAMDFIQDMRDRVAATNENAAAQKKLEGAQVSKESLTLEEQAFKKHWEEIFGNEEMWWGKMDALTKYFFKQRELEAAQSEGNLKNIEATLIKERGDLWQEALRQDEVTQKQIAENREWFQRRAEEQARRNRLEWEEMAKLPREPGMERLGPILGPRFELGKVGIQPLEEQLNLIKKQREYLAMMEDPIQKGGYTAGDIAAQRAKILEMENNIRDVLSGENEELLRQVDAAKKHNDERQQQLVLELELKKALEGREAADAYRQTYIDELLRVGDIADGWRAFWLEMQQHAQSTADIFYKGMMSSLDAVSKNLAGMASGKKVSWTKTFGDIGQQMSESSIKSTLQRALGSIGEKMGIKPPILKRRDGQTEGTAPFVIPVDKNGKVLGGWPAGLSPVGLGQPTSETAPLGTPEPGTAGTGEQTPQTQAQDESTWRRILRTLMGGGGSGTKSLGDIFTGADKSNPAIMHFSSGSSYQNDDSDNSDDGSSSQVAGAAYQAGLSALGALFNSSSKTKAAPSACYTINVDARGADENVIYDRVSRGVMAAMQATVSTSMQAMMERSQRTAA